ncbi:hypothetical protein BDV29DRAFT_157924 [Aspergillus leporis]|uniref:Mitochondrial export protein Som1 n=1 Tax=Aspergillus leporis TaxID=41062 RepID=A0A5N5WX50_9EURO|nr:hypothetical protein BDV29DRAFT_157924 [Aspergillus leporis]
MAPLVPIFSADSLPDHVSIVRRNFQERRRKGGPVELEKCKLLEMVQYSCNPPQDGIPPPGVVVCKPVVRLFRRCANGLTAETTAWEPIRLAEEAKRKAAESSSNADDK